jgi:hypothetical protein
MKNFFKQFGGRVSPELIREYEKSDRWIKGKFRNLERTKLSMSLAKFPRIIYKQFITKRKQAPQSPLPVLPFASGSGKNDLVWTFSYHDESSG